MFEYPDTFRYTDSHEYIRLEGDVATIGITAFAIDQLGDIVFIDLPAVGATIGKGEPFGTVESVKAVEDMYAPLNGEILAVNTALVDNPEQISVDPYGEFWMVKVRVGETGDLDDTMTAAEYRNKVEGN